MTHAAPPRRIAFFMHDFASGGVERMRLNLTASLAARGHDVSLIVVRATGPLLAALPEGVRLIDLGRDRTWQAIPSLARYVARNTPDVLVSSLDHNNIAALAARIISGGRTKLVICQHNTLSAERDLGWRYRIVPLAYRSQHRWADAMIAVSRGVATDLASCTGVPASKIVTIGNPALDSMRPPSSASPPHPWLADPQYRTFILAGRLVAQKDPLTALRGFAIHAQANPHARLILLGEGPLRPAIESEARRLGICDRLHLAGFVPNPADWIAHADALLLTSRYEGFGNVLAEALACGTPVVSTDCPHGPSEILEAGAHGCLVPPNDPDALARALATDLRARFPAAQLRQRAAAFTISACAQAHEALFDRLLAPEPPPRLFGLSFTALDARQIAERMLLTPRPQAQRTVITPNADHIRLLGNPQFRAACQSASILCADGWPIAAYAWLRGIAPLRRVTGCDIVHTLFTHPARDTRRVLIVTESADTTMRLQRHLGRQGCTTNWSFLTAPENLGGDKAAQARLATLITRQSPDILIMTLGAPVSEVFLATHVASLPPCWALCAGQAVRVELGLAPRAPAPVRSLGLEWAWRILREPRRLGLRYIRAACFLPPAILADLRGR